MTTCFMKQTNGKLCGRAVYKSKLCKRHYNLAVKLDRPTVCLGTWPTDFNSDCLRSIILQLPVLTRISASLVCKHWFLSCKNISTSGYVTDLMWDNNLVLFKFLCLAGIKITIIDIDRAIQSERYFPIVFALHPKLCLEYMKTDLGKRTNNLKLKYPPGMLQVGDLSYTHNYKFVTTLTDSENLTTLTDSENLV